MKLLTDNFLSSQFLKGVSTGYPLILRATKVEVSAQTAFVSFTLCHVKFVKFACSLVEIPSCVFLVSEEGSGIQRSVHEAHGSEARLQRLEGRSCQHR